MHFLGPIILVVAAAAALPQPGLHIRRQSSTRKTDGDAGITVDPKVAVGALTGTLLLGVGGGHILGQRSKPGVDEIIEGYLDKQFESNGPHDTDEPELDQLRNLSGRELRDLQECHNFGAILTHEELKEYFKCRISKGETIRISVRAGLLIRKHCMAEMIRNKPDLGTMLASYKRREGDESSSEDDHPDRFSEFRADVGQALKQAGSNVKADLQSGRMLASLKASFGDRGGAPNKLIRLGPR